MNLESIHAGDTLVYCDSRGRRSLMQVIRETPTQLIMADGTKYRKTTGTKVARRQWDLSQVLIPRIGEMAEIDNEVAKRRLVNDLNHRITRRTLEGLTRPQLETLGQLLEEFQSGETDQG